MPERDRFKVFVSYSRVDSALADEIAAGLEYDGGFEILIDRHDIHEGEEWRSRLGALISQADTVVFILSRSSAVSSICRWEVEHARALSKRIIPIQAEALGALEAPPVLAALNYVRFDEGRSFMAGLAGLRRALKTDLEWLREHTRLLTRAQEWEAADRAGNRLLSGSDIAAAKAWLDRSPAEGLQPTELHRDFIQASDHAEALRVSAERERAERLAGAVKRTRRALGVAVALACVAGGLGLYATRQREAAVVALRAADAAADDARHQRDSANTSAEIARAESERADRFVNLVSSDEAGKRAMRKICLEAIQVTATLATEVDGPARHQAAERFWELYYASMYIVELHQRKKCDGGSSIEGSMVAFGGELKSFDSSKGPVRRTALPALAEGVRAECLKYVSTLDAGGPCR